MPIARAPSYDSHIATKKFSWSNFENELGAEFRAALSALASASRGETFYACALWVGYREEEGTLSLPTLSVAGESNAPPPDDEGFWGIRWNPGDWSNPQLEIPREVHERLESALHSEANRSTRTHWLKVEERLFRMLIRLARKLRNEAPSLLPTTADFVCFVHEDGPAGFELAAQSIPPHLIKKLFSSQLEQAAARNALTTMADDERARHLVKRLGHFDGLDTEVAQEELLVMGEAALPALIDCLDDPKVGWTAAMLLGKVGAAEPTAIAALRERVRGSLWHATALGMLGDYGWLSAQSAEVAVTGLCARLKAISQGESRPRLDYGPLERFLDNAEPATLAMVERELKPGTSYVDIAASDVEEVARGMQSDHAVVRWHAASVAGERNLGQKAGRRLLPALAELLADGHPLVRRLAVLSMGYWKVPAQEFRPLIEKLVDDHDEIVRRSAQLTLDRIGRSKEGVPAKQAN